MTAKESILNEFTASQTEWLESLESGEFIQTREVLCQKNSTGAFEFCCLGVACELQYKKGVISKNIYSVQDTRSSSVFEYAHEEFSTLPFSVMNHYNFRESAGWFMLPWEDLYLRGFVGELTNLNDSYGWNFKEIALFVRKYPWQVFANFSVPDASIFHCRAGYNLLSKKEILGD